MVDEVGTDWQNREFISTVETAVRKCCDFLNNFHESAKYRLSVVGQRLSTLERKLDFLEATLENCDPSQRNAKSMPFKSSLFDPTVRKQLIQRQLDNRSKNQRIFASKVVAPKKSDAKTTKLIVVGSNNNNNNNNINKQPMIASQPSQQPKQQKQPRQPQQQPKQQKQQSPPQPPKQSIQPKQPKQSVQPPIQSSPPQPPKVSQQKVVQQQPPQPPKPPQPPQPPVVKQQKQPQPKQQQQQQPPPQPPKPPQPPQPPVVKPPGASNPSSNNPSKEEQKQAPPPPPQPGAVAPPPPNASKFPHQNPTQIDIKVIEPTNGAIPGPNSAVEIEYTGFLQNKKQFIQHREVIQLGKRQNIKGLEQGICRMKVGSLVHLWIPSKLGYGSRGAGNLIPPNSDLTFHLRLHKIVKQ